MIFIWPAATVPGVEKLPPLPVTVYRPRVSNGYACHYRRVVRIVWPLGSDPQPPATTNGLQHLNSLCRAVQFRDRFGPFSLKRCAKGGSSLEFTAAHGLGKSFLDDTRQKKHDICVLPRRSVIAPAVRGIDKANSSLCRCLQLRYGKSCVNCRWFSTRRRRRITRDLRFPGMEESCLLIKKKEKKKKKSERDRASLV